MRRTRVAVGTANPLKVDAVRKAFSPFYEDPEVSGVEVESGVSSQPFGDEVMKGAINRAVRARRTLDADFGVGLEGGTQILAGRTFNFGWAAVAHRSGKIRLGSSGWWECPPSILTELIEGEELGELVDRMTGRKDTKMKEGAIGVFTGGELTREDVTANSVVLALIPFLNKEYYEE